MGVEYRKGEFRWKNIGRENLKCWPNTLPAAVNTNFTKQRNSDKKAFFSVNLIFFHFST